MRDASSFSRPLWSRIALWLWPLVTRVAVPYSLRYIRIQIEYFGSSKKCEIIWFVYQSSEKLLFFSWKKYKYVNENFEAFSKYLCYFNLTLVIGLGSQTVLVTRNIFKAAFWLLSSAPFFYFLFALFSVSICW